MSYRNRDRSFRIQIAEENRIYHFPSIMKRYPNEIAQSKENTRLYKDVRTLEVKLPEPTETKVEVRSQDTLEAAWAEVEQGFSPLVLNMASDRRPGGGYKKGSMAQEEELFRRTSLALSLEHNPALPYPLQLYNTIYTPKVLVFRSTASENYGVYKWNNCCWVDIISVAALRNPKLINGSTYTNQDLNIMSEKIRGIFKVGIDQGHDCLLLSALGCGAFYNPPEQVASIFKKVMKEFEGSFKKVVFSILDRNGYNFRTFKRILLDE